MFYTLNHLPRPLVNSFGLLFYLCCYLSGFTYLLQKSESLNLDYNHVIMLKLWHMVCGIVRCSAMLSSAFFSDVKYLNWIFFMMLSCVNIRAYVYFVVVICCLFLYRGMALPCLVSWCIYFVVFVQFLLECAEQLPHKIPLYGTLVEIFLSLSISLELSWHPLFVFLYNAIFISCSGCICMHECYTDMRSYCSSPSHKYCCYYYF